MGLFVRMFTPKKRRRAKENPKEFIHEITEEMRKHGNAREQEAFSEILSILLENVIPERSFDLLEKILMLWASGQLRTVQEAAKYWRKRMATKGNFNPLYDEIYVRAKGIYDFRYSGRWQRLDKSLMPVSWKDAVKIALSRLTPEERAQIDEDKLQDALKQQRRRDILAEKTRVAHRRK